MYYCTTGVLRLLSVTNEALKYQLGEPECLLVQVFIGDGGVCHGCDSRWVIGGQRRQYCSTRTRARARARACACACVCVLV